MGDGDVWGRVGCLGARELFGDWGCLRMLGGVGGVGITERFWGAGGCFGGRGGFGDREYVGMWGGVGERGDIWGHGGVWGQREHLGM